jgi:hypothetical protein
MKVRTSYRGFLSRVEAYFQQLLPILAKHVWRRGDDPPGPMIAVQIENEYGTFLEHSLEVKADKAYLESLRDLLVKGGLDGAYFFMSDSPNTELGLCTFDNRECIS